MSGANHPDALVIFVDRHVPVVKLCRALATHGLVLSNTPTGQLLLHEAPSPKPVDPARVGLDSEAPAVVIRFPRIFRTEWWKR